MSLVQTLASEFDHEMANTRRMLERLPEDKLGWKPHPKSMDLGHLAGHITEMVGFTEATLSSEVIDVDPATHQPLIAISRKQLLEEFDKRTAGAKRALANASDQDLAKTFTLRIAGNVLFSMPKAAVLRSMLMSHIIHHRAQMTVYYRMNEVPVPSLYGPSADESAPAAGSAAS